MPTGKFRYERGPFSRQETDEWARAIEQAHPDCSSMEDRAAQLIVDCLRQSSDCILCFDGQAVVGAILYGWDDRGSCINLYSLAVLVSHRRQGIGSSLLEKVMDKARGRVPILTASCVLPRAQGILTRTGFWTVKNYLGHTLYKWSDVADHQNKKALGDDWEWTEFPG
jgi:ribosomal protein S18 acetylase RimI-like enzyme